MLLRQNQIKAFHAITSLHRKIHVQNRYLEELCKLFVLKPQKQSKIGVLLPCFFICPISHLH